MSDPARLVAVQRGRRVLPTLPMPLDAIARLAATLLGAPIGVITLIAEQREHFAGSYGLPPALAAGGEASLAYSVCKYVVSADAPVSSDDMSVDDDPQLRDHPLNSEYAVRAFLGVPLRDAGDRPLGSLTVLHTSPCAWTGAQLSTLLEVAELIGPVPAAGTVLDGTALAALDPALVLDTMAEAFIALDPDARVTGWNRAAHEMFGYSAQEAAGHPVDELLKAEYDGDPVDQVITRLLTGRGGPLSGRARLRHRDGRTVYADVRFAVVHSPAGAAACAFVTDTTRHVTAAIDVADAMAGDLAEALAAADADAQAQRGFIAALLDSLREGVVAFDRTGSPVVFNRALRELCGVPADYSPSEAVDVTLGQLHQLDDAELDPDRTAMARAMNGQIVRDADSVLIIPGLPDRYLQCNAQPIRDSDGRQVGAVSTVRDTTERRRTARFRACELAVATILNRADSVTGAAPVVLAALARALDWPYAALWLTDEVGDSVCLIGEYTAPGYHTAGLLPAKMPRDAAGVIGQVWDTGRSVWLPEVTESALMAERAPLEAFVQACHDEGLTCLSAVPVRDGGTVLGVLSCVAATTETDEFLITGLLDTTAAQFGHFLIRNRTAELATRLDRARVDFAVSVGHDMRTPLTAITTCTDLLLAAPHTVPDDVRVLRVIERNSGRLRGLIDSLLQFAALHAERLTREMVDVDLTTLVTDACDAAGLTAELHLDDDVRIIGEPALLQHLVDLLLTGAIESHPGGTLDVTLTRDGGAARLTLRLPGAAVTGAPEGALNTGRALARAIVERHRGTLTFTGTTDTVVDVRLPSQAVRFSPA